MDAVQVRPGDRVTFVHRSKHWCEDNHRLGVVTSIISLPHELFGVRLDGSDSRHIMAFAEELELTTELKTRTERKLRDFGALYKEMHKDLEQLMEATGGNLDAMSAWLVDRGWDKKL